MSDYEPLNPAQDSLGSKWLHKPTGLTVELTRERSFPGLRWGEKQLDGTYAGLHAPRYEWVVECLGSKSHRVLDAGCGSGYGSGILADAGHIVVGIDNSAEAVAFCLTTQPRATFTTRTMPDLRGLGDFDAIVSIDSIEHVVEDAATIRAFRDLLLPGGRLLITTPQRDDTRPMSEWHVREYTMVELITLLTSNGFEEYPMMYMLDHDPYTLAVEAVAV